MDSCHCQSDKSLHNDNLPHNDISHIVILTSATGGGHNACAEALHHAFRARYGDSFRVTVVDLWKDYAPWPLNLLPRSYYFFINVLPWVWFFLWHMLAKPVINKPVFAVIGHWIRPRMKTALQTLQPDLVICVHPLVQRAVRQSFQMHPQPAVPWYTVVTDLTSAHPLWFDPTVERCFVPTKAAMEIALANGMPSDRIVTAGLPSSQFELGVSNDPRCPLILDDSLPIILVMGGAEGMGPLEAVVQSIDSQLEDFEQPVAQMVIVCGSNERLQAKLSSQRWSMPATVLGFVDNVQAWMAVSHLLVTKAGPSTITEALNVGLPLLLTGYLPGQEVGNVDYVVGNGAGMYCPNPAQIGQTVQRWLVDHPEERSRFAAQAKRMAQADAADEIADQLASDYNTRKSLSPQELNHDRSHPAYRSSFRVEVY